MAALSHLLVDSADLSGHTSTKKSLLDTATPNLVVNETRQRLSITLSPKTSESFAFLKDITDADTDSEVVRNALRFHFALLKRHSEGAKFYISEPGSNQPIAIDLFATV